MLPVAKSFEGGLEVEDSRAAELKHTCERERKAALQDFGSHASVYSCPGHASYGIDLNLKLVMPTFKCTGSALWEQQFGASMHIVLCSRCPSAPQHYHSRLPHDSSYHVWGTLCYVGERL